MVELRLFDQRPWNTGCDLLTIGPSCRIQLLTRLDQQRRRSYVEVTHESHLSKPLKWYPFSIWQRDLLRQTTNPSLAASSWTQRCGSMMDRALKAIGKSVVCFRLQSDVSGAQ